MVFSTSSVTEVSCVIKRFIGGSLSDFHAALFLAHFPATKGQKSFRAGSTLFGIAALTVNMGSFTTWLNFKCNATLHSK